MQYSISLLLKTKQENIRGLTNKIKKQFKKSSVRSLDDTTIMCTISVDNNNVGHLISKINSALRIDRATLYEIGTPEPENVHNEKNIEEKEKPSIFHWTILIPLLCGPIITLATLTSAVFILEKNWDFTIFLVIAVPTLVHLTTQFLNLFGAIGNAHLKKVINYFESNTSIKHT